MKIEFTVNEALRVVDTHPMTRLLDLLRNDMSLKGCKEGCGEGECGACSVIMDGRLVNACMIPSIQAAGTRIMTVEGLGTTTDPDMLQTAFVEEGAVHCGFCTPGMILAARVLLQDNAKPSHQDIRIALSGNLCRCTGYNRIYAAVERVVEGGYAAPKWPVLSDEKTSRPVFSDTEKDSFFSPVSLEEALEILEARSDLVLLAGGTDTGPDIKNGKLKVPKAMDIFKLKELKKIELYEREMRIGSCVTDADLAENDNVGHYFPILREAAFLSAAPAVRNRATIGGNLCTASGAADLPVALLALDGKVCLQSKKGERVLSVEDFIKGYRKADLKPGEILREIIIPLPKAEAVRTRAQKFYKRGSRAALTLSRVALAFVASVDNGVISDFRAAAGSMSPIPVRLPQLEALLKKKKISPVLIEQAVNAIRTELNPRKSTEYRKALAGNLMRRFLEGLC